MTITHNSLGGDRWSPDEMKQFDQLKQATERQLAQQAGMSNIRNSTPMPKPSQKLFDLDHVHIAQFVINPNKTLGGLRIGAIGNDGLVFLPPEALTKLRDVLNMMVPPSITEAELLVAQATKGRLQE